MIKKSLLLMVIVCAMSVYAHAQELPRFEFAVTYNLFVADIDALDNEATHGYGLAMQANLNPHFALVAEWTAAHGSSGPITVLQDLNTINFSEVDTRFQTFLGGPRVTFRKGRTNTFVHYLVGVGNMKVENEQAGFHTGNGEFAMGIGGGLDIYLGKKVSLRAAQFDYLPIHTDIQTRLVNNGDGTASVGDTSTGWVHNTRFQTGLVFRFGKK